MSEEEMEDPLSYIDWITVMQNEDRANEIKLFVNRTRQKKYQMYQKYVKYYECSKL